MSANPSIPRLEVLDGWRGISIVCVLAAHLLPMGPKVLQFNAMLGLLGMTLFFTLSGFLITSFLLKNPTTLDFLIRRFFRIIPLAWLYLLIALTIAGVSSGTWFSHLFFYANLPPVHLVTLTEHIWSLCLEMQFYVGIALLYAIFGVRGLLAIPLIAVLFTLLRVADGVYASSISYYRADEILAGCTLALIYQKHGNPRLLEWMRRIPQSLLLVLLLISCHEEGLAMNYLRPYLAALLIGSTILHPTRALAPLLNNRVLFYLATTSYALYVIHPLLAGSWLGSGDVIVKYLKRPLLFIILFALAHLSTFYYEHWWMANGKSLVEKLKLRAASRL